MQVWSEGIISAFEIMLHIGKGTNKTHKKMHVIPLKSAWHTRKGFLKKCQQGLQHLDHIPVTVRE